MECLKPGRKVSDTADPKRTRVNGYNREYYEQNKENIRQQKTELMRKYRTENPEKYRKQSREAKARLKERLFEVYGHRCAICDFEDKRALTLDHINQNGNHERKLLGERGVYVRALNEYRPDEYRTLCMNCQFIERQKEVPAVSATAWRLLTEDLDD